MVRAEGLEPPRREAFGPKPSASTNSATPALGQLYIWLTANNKVGGAPVALSFAFARRRGGRAAKPVVLDVLAVERAIRRRCLHRVER